MHAPLANGFRLYYETHGAGLPVVFLHGFGGTHDLWKYQVPAVAPHYQAITVDLRGHGQSDKPPGPYSIGGFAADVLGLLDYLKVEQAVVVGLSVGGGTAQTFALATRSGCVPWTSSPPAGSSPPPLARFYQHAATAQRAEWRSWPRVSVHRSPVREGVKATITIDVTHDEAQHLAEAAAHRGLTTSALITRWMQEQLIHEHEGVASFCTGAWPRSGRWGRTSGSAA